MNILTDRIPPRQYILSNCWCDCASFHVGSSLEYKKLYNWLDACVEVGIPNCICGESQARSNSELKQRFNSRLVIDCVSCNSKNEKSVLYIGKGT